MAPPVPPHHRHVININGDYNNNNGAPMAIPPPPPGMMPPMPPGMVPREFTLP